MRPRSKETCGPILPWRKAPLHLVATKDVDVRADYTHAVESEFRRLLVKEGLELDPLGHEIWMPTETRYQVSFAGEFVTLELADMEAILLSKAPKAPTKNRALIVEYLAAGATERFLKMAEKYGLDLETFL
jgi:hypothetical protein